MIYFDIMYFYHTYSQYIYNFKRNYAIFTR